MNNNSSKITTNLIWRLLERFGAQIVTFVVSIVLARLLNPEVYGVVALLTVFIAILQVFVDSGLGTALIQKKDADQVDFSTVFYTNIIYCTFLYLVLFVLAPAISAFYNNQDLTNYIRVLGITLLISGVKNVEQAYVSRNMLFKKFFWSTLFGTVVSAIIGIYLAFKGYGPWALIFQSLTNTAIDTIVLWIIVKWRPTKDFSFRRLRELYKFGWKLLVSALLETSYNEFTQLVIGKKYSSEQLAYYNKGKQLPNLLATNINSSFDSILLPALSKEQDNRERVKALTKRVLKTSVYVIAPMMVGIAAIGDNLILFLLGPKWIECVFFLRIFCITYIFWPIHTANLNAIKAMGRSDYFLVLEIIKKGIGIALILFAMQISVNAIAWSILIASVVSHFINSWPNKRLLNYSFFEQIKDIGPTLLCAATMGLLVFFVGYIPFPHYLLTMFIQIIVGIFVYFLFSATFKLDGFIFVKRIVASFMSKIFKKIPADNHTTNF